MAMNKTIIICGVVAGVVVVGAAGGAILAVNMSSNNISSTTKAEEKVKLNGWQQKNGDWYYYKDDAAQTSWIQDNNNWYFLDDSGKMKLNWLQDKNKWFYLGSDGKMRTGWIQDQGKWYYLNSDGTMATNTTIDGCYLNENGIIIDTPAKTATKSSEDNGFTYEDAIRIVTTSGMYNDKIAGGDPNESKYENGKKYYHLILKSKELLGGGGSATAGWLKVFEDGTIYDEWKEKTYYKGNYNSNSFTMSDARFILDSAIGEGDIGVAKGGSNQIKSSNGRKYYELWDAIVQNEKAGRTDLRERYRVYEDGTIERINKDGSIQHISADGGVIN
jgi:hypothetical protein